VWVPLHPAIQRRNATQQPMKSRPGAPMTLGNAGRVIQKKIDRSVN
jgi:hypothetical protein